MMGSYPAASSWRAAYSSFFFCCFSLCGKGRVLQTGS